MKIYYCLFIPILFVFACQKDDDLPFEVCTIPADTTIIDELKVLWQKPLNPVDTGYYASFPPVIYRNNVLFSLRFFKDWDILYMRNGNTGKVLWSWDNPIGAGYSLSKHGQDVYENKLLYGVQRRNYCIDLNAGSTLWADEDPQNGGPRIRLVGKYYYRESDSEGLPNTYSSLLRTDLNLLTPEWDTVFTLHRSNQNGYSPALQIPSLWIHSSEDSVLIFQNRQIHYPELHGRIDLYAYNLSQDSILWRRDSITPSGNSSVQAPLIHEDKIYFAGLQSILCFDALSGDLLWQNKLGNGNFEHFLSSNMLIEEGLLLIKNDNEYLHALNPDTGVEIWRQTQTAGASTDMVYYKGKVYFNGGGRLFSVEVKTGKVIWEFRSPNRDKGYPNALFGLSGINIDPELKHLYATDGHFAMCIELPE